MKKLRTLLLILQMFCLSLSANTHFATVNHDHHEEAHQHFEVETRADLNSNNFKSSIFKNSIFKNELHVHDPSSHSHLSLDIVILSEDHEYSSFKHSWASNFHTMYTSHILSPPVPPPSTLKLEPST
jgi:hypothetical protein